MPGARPRHWTAPATPCTCSGSNTTDDALTGIPAQPDRILTPAEAQAMQDRGEAAAWVVIGCDPRHPGKLVARPHTCAPDGGRYLACVLVSDSLANLRARMPAGVSRRSELAFPVPDMIEMWD